MKNEIEYAAAKARREALMEAEEAIRRSEDKQDAMNAARAIMRWDGHTPFPESTPGEATELEYLSFFVRSADFGPADGDIRLMIQQEFEKKTGKRIPKGWRDYLDEHESQRDG